MHSLEADGDVALVDSWCECKNKREQDGAIKIEKVRRQMVSSPPLRILESCDDKSVRIVVFLSF